MTLQQGIVFAVLAGTLVLFLWGRWRYDVVALVALLALVVTGLVDARQAFSGFGHPAVVTVAAVLVLSRAVANAGVVDLAVRWIDGLGSTPAVHVAAFALVATLLSGFMNNVGALALLMPVALHTARRSDYPPSLVLMPLAFGSLLGGLVTLIGTPPNIIIATFRADVRGEPFGMFDFTPVGASVAVAGAAFIATVGWRVIPRRAGQASREELFDIGNYLSELSLPQDSDLAGKTLREARVFSENDVLVVGIYRGPERLIAPSARTRLRAGDVLIVEADSEALDALDGLDSLELHGRDEVDAEVLQEDGESGLAEAVVTQGSPLVEHSVREANLRSMYGLNLLAVARQGVRLASRLADVRFRPGDVLLLQGARENMHRALATLRCLPLAERRLDIGRPRRLFLPLAVFAAAIAAAATGLLDISVAFVAAILPMGLLGVLSLREVYESVDWPVIVLLGAMIPMGSAMETTGAASLIADQVLRVGNDAPAWLTVGIVLVATMFLSDLVNNAAAAVLMAPIALVVAEGLGAGPDPFLMAVAIGASCAFLTPIGHQSNTIILGPGGYRFGDYWRLGLLVEAIVVAVAVPMILVVWPP